MKARRRKLPEHRRSKWSVRNQQEVDISLTRLQMVHSVYENWSLSWWGFIYCGENRWEIWPAVTSDYTCSIHTYLWYHLPLNSSIYLPFAYAYLPFCFTIYSGWLPFFQFHLFLSLRFSAAAPPPPCCQRVTDRCRILSASLCNCILLVIELSWSPGGATGFSQAASEDLTPSSPIHVVTRSLPPSFASFFPLPSFPQSLLPPVKRKKN